MNYKLNLNNYIKVKITNEGFQHLVEEYNRIRIHFPSVKEKTIEDYKKLLSPDKDGYTTMQMHDFMNKFGEITSIGQRNKYFELTILIPENSLET